MTKIIDKATLKAYINRHVATKVTRREKDECYAKLCIDIAEITASSLATVMNGVMAARKYDLINEAIKTGRLPS